jgi:zinc transport system substrate-binding protein
MRCALLAGAMGIGLAGQAGAAAAPPVVATILPVHSLTAAVMEGVGEPELLLPPGASPHAYIMKQSDAAALERAELVVWIGEELETFLARGLETLAGDAERLALIDAPGVEVIRLADEAHGHDDHGHGEEAHGHDHGDVDPHIWLAPANAKAMTRALADALAAIDPPHASTYAANAEATVSRIEELADDLRAELAPVRDVPYVVFHDAYRYFEQAFGLENVGAVTLSPDQSPGTAHVAELRGAIRAADVACVFAEPQFEPRLVETLVAGTAVRAGELDPVGAGLTPSPAAYFQLMRGLADDLRDCLAPSG